MPTRSMSCRTTAKVGEPLEITALGGTKSAAALNLTEGRIAFGVSRQASAAGEAARTATMTIGTTEHDLKLRSRS